MCMFILHEWFGCFLHVEAVLEMLLEFKSNLFFYLELTQWFQNSLFFWSLLQKLARSFVFWPSLRNAQNKVLPVPPVFTVATLLLFAQSW